MSSLSEIMGQETYDLIYTHYDADGNRIDDPDDILYCEDRDIDQSRISKLRRLLTPVSTPKEVLVPMEAAKLLAAWGVEDAVDYFKYCIDARIDRLGNLEPHRLHGYDTTYEEMTESLLHFWSRCADRSEEDKGFDKIEPLISKILSLALELPYNMSYLIPTVKREGWRLFEGKLKDCFAYLLSKGETCRNDYWNIIDLKLLFQDWDPDFLNKMESQYGFIKIPDSAKDRI